MELPFADSDLFPHTEKQLHADQIESGKARWLWLNRALRQLIKLFEHGKTLGSLIRIPPKAGHANCLRHAAASRTMIASSPAFGNIALPCCCCR